MDLQASGLSQKKRGNSERAFGSRAKSFLVAGSFLTGREEKKRRKEFTVIGPLQWGGGGGGWGGGVVNSTRKALSLLNLTHQEREKRKKNFTLRRRRAHLLSLFYAEKRLLSSLGNTMSKRGERRSGASKSASFSEVAPSKRKASVSRGKKGEEEKKTISADI